MTDQRLSDEALHMLYESVLYDRQPMSIIGGALTLALTELQQRRAQAAPAETAEDRIRCADCGEPHYLDCSVPSDVWNQIATPDTVLCARCIDKRLVEHHLRATCRFYFVGKALTGDVYPEAPAETAEDAVGRAAHAAWKAWRVEEAGYPDHPFRWDGFNWGAHNGRRCTCNQPENCHHEDMVDWDDLSPKKRRKYIVQGMAGWEARGRAAGLTADRTSSAD